MQEILLVLGFVAGGFGAPFPGPALGALAVQVGPPKVCNPISCMVHPDTCDHCVQPPRPPPQKPDPTALHREEILAGLNPLDPPVQACAVKLAFHGVVHAKLTIEAAGTISNATFWEGNVPPELETCIKKAVQRVRFRHSGQPINVLHTFSLR